MSRSGSRTKCWAHTSDVPPSPSMLVTMRAHEGGKDVTKAIQVDTGFSGSIAIDQELIDSLGPEKIGDIHIATATSTYVKVDLYLIYLTIPEINIKEKPFAALRATRSLIGRKLLNDRKWLLDNIADEFCLLV